MNITNLTRTDMSNFTTEIAMTMGKFHNGTVEIITNECEKNIFMFKASLAAAIATHQNLLHILLALNGLLFILSAAGLFPNEKIKNPYLKELHKYTIKYIAFACGIGMGIAIGLIYFVELGTT